MASTTIELSDQSAEFVDAKVRSGEFRDREAVVNAAIADWRTRTDALHAAIQEGIDAYEVGDFTEIDDVAEWFTGLRQSAA